MHSEEAASAYGAYKTVKEIANTKKFKKNQNGAKNKKKFSKLSPKNAVNRKVMEESESAGNMKTVNSTGQLKSTAKQSNKTKKTKQKPQIEGNNSHSISFTGSETINLVEQLYDSTLKLTKAEQKKKKDLESYLVRKLVIDDRLEKTEESLGGTLAEEEGSSPNSNSNYNEYTSNEEATFSDGKTGDEESSSSPFNTNLSEYTMRKTNKKRKGPNTSLTKAQFSIISDTKKFKKAEGNNSHLNESLPVLKESKAVASTSTATNIKLEPLSPPANIIKLNSIEEGKRAFQWVLNPITVERFFSNHWEQNACLIKRRQSNYFGHLISFTAIDQMLLKNHIEFTKNIDVTSYKNGMRETLNPDGRALPPVVWDHYGQGCSIRLLNPQTYLPSLYTLCTTLQEYFHCLVGANAYLTPPNSQGFAPHYDDIEAFVLQIEGRKRWKLYKPRNTSEILPRYSSKNFTQQDVGKPVLEAVLHPGDVLYFPRGTIHQACTETGHHSLHITLSVYQKQSFADLFEKMLPSMLQKAIATTVDFRKGLPLHIWQQAGIAHSNNSTKERDDLILKITQLTKKFMCYLPLEEIMDAEVDQLAKKFHHEALPPEILPAEKLRTVFGSRSSTNEGGECLCDYKIDERTNVRLLRANILRLVEEEKNIRIYYYLDNSKEYCEYEPNFIEIEHIDAASVEILIRSYPQYVGVSQLPLPSDEKKISLVTALWERGLLMMEKPFR